MDVFVIEVSRQVPQSNKIFSVEELISAGYAIYSQHELDLLHKDLMEMIPFLKEIPVRFSENRVENRFVVHANVIYWQENIEYMPEKYQSFMEAVHKNHVVCENRFLRLSPKDLAIFNGPSCNRRTKDAEIGTLDVAYFYSESV